MKLELIMEAAGPGDGFAAGAGVEAGASIGVVAAAMELFFERIAIFGIPEIIVTALKLDFYFVELPVVDLAGPRICSVMYLRSYIV